MASHIREAAPVRNDGSALSVVVQAGQAINDRENNPNSDHLQVAWLSRRFGLSATHACLIASLVFERTAA